MTHSDRVLSKLLFDNKDVIRHLISERAEYFRIQARRARLNGSDNAISLQEKAIAYQHVADEIKRLSDAALEEILAEADLTDSKFLETD